METVDSLKHRYTPDLRGDHLLNIRRNARQVDPQALERVFETLTDRFGLEVPQRFDEEFYRGLDRGPSAPVPADELAGSVS